MNDIVEQHERWWAERIPPNGGGGAPEFTKLVEEVGELAAAFHRGRHLDAQDAVGDIAITLMTMCMAMGWSFEACLASAWEQVRTRDYIKYPGKGRP